MFSRAAVFLFSACFVTAAHAGAWLQPKGSGLGIAQANYYTTDKYFDSEGQLKSQPRFTKYEFQPYVEYGLFDNLTIGGSAYVQRVAQSGKGNEGIADPEFFLRTRIWHNETQTVSLQPLVKASSYFVKNGSPRGGSKSTDAELSVLYGRTLNILTPNDYVDMRVGYRMRNHGLSDQVRMDTSIGLKLSDTFELVPALRTTVATKPTDVGVYSENGELDYGLLKAELTGIYHLNDAQWVHAGFFKHVEGVQTGDGYGITLGFAQHF